ncbi:MAG: hypothetical protein KC492_02540 [Myxococcales bacterium]|nr:hypothetical protein [Myxococcales bacterium]
MAAKADEQEAREKRVLAELALVAALDSLPIEGTFNSEFGRFNVTVKTGINRRTTREALEAISDRVPEAFKKRLIRWKPEVDLRELRFIQNNEPELYAVVSQAITETPAKPSVTVALGVES